jgi:hypothetical protein
MGHPLLSPTVQGVDENLWIQELRTLWNSAPLRYLPRFKDGDMILDALVEYPTPIPVYENLLDDHELYKGQAPVMEHVVADLIHAPEDSLNIVDQSVGYGTESHKEQVLVSMWKAAYATTENCTVKLFSVPDLPSHPNGTGKCKITLPRRLLDLAVTDTEDAKGSWSSTFCPPGTITDIHTDYHGGSQVIIGISTKKLWLFWPPTEKNLRWWSNHNLRTTTSHITLEAIHSLEGLTLLYQQGRQAFFLPPFHIHAVLTFEVSAHSGTAIWDYGAWKDTARRGTEWEFTWARDYFENGHSLALGVQGLQYILHAMTRWDKLHKKLIKKAGFPKPELVEFGLWTKSYLNKVQQNLESLESL